MKTIIASLALCSATAGAAGLEIALATPTTMGPKLTEIDGCYALYRLAQAWQSEASMGYPLRAHLEAIDRLSARQRHQVSGMPEVLRELAIRVRAGRHSGILKECRDANGETWVFLKSGG